LVAEIATHSADVEFESLLAATRRRECRTEVRYPLFTTVTLRPARTPEKVVSAFSREISTRGIGLVHVAPLVKGEIYEVDIRVQDVYVCKIACIEWCRGLGEGWHLSGCRFV
jgi:hypothetical protein